MSYTSNSKIRALFSAALLSGVFLVAAPAAADKYADCGSSNPDRAIKGCSAIIKIRREVKRNLADAYYNRGIAYAHKGDDDRAIADFNTAIKLNPKDRAAYNNRGIAYARKGDDDRAIADYDKAIELDPRDAIAYNNRGNAYARKGDDDRAIADYNTAIKLDPKLGPAYYSRADAYERLAAGQSGEDAIASLKRAEADWWMALLYMRTDDRWHADARKRLSSVEKMLADTIASTTCTNVGSAESIIERCSNAIQGTSSSSKLADLQFIRGQACIEIGQNGAAARDLATTAEAEQTRVAQVFELALKNQELFDEFAVALAQTGLQSSSRWNEADLDYLLKLLEYSEVTREYFIKVEPMR